MLSYSNDESLVEFTRLMEWVNEDPETWDRVTGAFGDGMVLERETYVKIFEQLREKQFYQIIFLLFRATNNYDISEAVERATTMTLSRQINKKGLDQYIGFVIDSFIKLKKGSR